MLGKAVLMDQTSKTNDQSILLSIEFCFLARRKLSKSGDILKDQKLSATLIIIRKHYVNKAF